MMRGFVISFMVLLSLSACVEDQTRTASVPASFYYKGKPVDPICFQSEVRQNFEGGTPLSMCTGQAGQGPYKLDGALRTQEDGSIGYEFLCEDGCMRAPYIYYKYLGEMNNHHVLQIEEATGGTGHFSTLASFDLVDGILIHAQSYAGGDRCNHGIAAARVENNALKYRVNLTPFDILELAGNEGQFKAYDEIESCAICCVGQAEMENNELIAVHLIKDPLGGGENLAGEGISPASKCFYEVLKETTTKGETTLSGETLKAFDYAFNDRCAQFRN